MEEGLVSIDCSVACWLVAVAAVIDTVLWSSYVHVLMRDEKEASQTNNKAKQHSTPNMHMFIFQKSMFNKYLHVHVHVVLLCLCTWSGVSLHMYM